MTKHSIRYFAIDGGNRIPNNRSMGTKTWKWDATCAPCGWDSQTGGVDHAKIVELVAGHKAGEPRLTGTYAADATPAVYCGKCGNTERWATGLPGCPKCVPADTTAEDVAVAAAMNVETKNQRLARQARQRRAAKKTAKEAIIEATLPVNSFTR